MALPELVSHTGSRPLSAQSQDTGSERGSVSSCEIAVVSLKKSVTSPAIQRVPNAEETKVDWTLQETNGNMLLSNVDAGDSMRQLPEAS